MTFTDTERHLPWKWVVLYEPQPAPYVQHPCETQLLNVSVLAFYFFGLAPRWNRDFHRSVLLSPRTILLRHVARLLLLPALVLHRDGYDALVRQYGPERAERLRLRQDTARRDRPARLLCALAAPALAHALTVRHIPPVLSNIHPRGPALAVSHPPPVLSDPPHNSPAKRSPTPSRQDPLGLTEELTKEEVLRFREAELAHGRVSMVAALGFLVQENFHPLFPDIGGSAARQLDTVLQTETGQGIMASLLFTVMLTEIQRARVGWMPPSEGMQQLRPEYVPGDLGFDPLGMRPSSDADLLAMKNKELNNGACACRSTSRRLTRVLHLTPTTRRVGRTPCHARRRLFRRGGGAGRHPRAAGLRLSCLRRAASIPDPFAAQPLDSAD